MLDLVLFPLPKVCQLPQSAPLLRREAAPLWSYAGYPQPAQAIAPFQATLWSTEKKVSGVSCVAGCESENKVSFLYDTIGPKNFLVTTGMPLRKPQAWAHTVSVSLSSPSLPLSNRLAGLAAVSSLNFGHVPGHWGPVPRLPVPVPSECQQSLGDQLAQRPLRVREAPGVRWVGVQEGLEHLGSARFVLMGSDKNRDPGPTWDKKKAWEMHRASSWPGRDFCVFTSIQAQSLPLPQRLVQIPSRSLPSITRLFCVFISAQQAPCPGWCPAFPAMPAAPAASAGQPSWELQFHLQSIPPWAIPKHSVLQEFGAQLTVLWAEPTSAHVLAALVCS